MISPLTAEKLKKLKEELVLIEQKKKNTLLKDSENQIPSWFEDLVKKRIKFEKIIDE